MELCWRMPWWCEERVRLCAHVRLLVIACRLHGDSNPSDEWRRWVCLMQEVPQIDCWHVMGQTLWETETHRDSSTADRKRLTATHSYHVCLWLMSQLFSVRKMQTWTEVVEFCGWKYEESLGSEDAEAFYSDENVYSCIIWVCYLVRFLCFSLSSVWLDQDGQLLWWGGPMTFHSHGQRARPAMKYKTNDCELNK